MSEPANPPYTRTDATLHLIGLLAIYNFFLNALGGHPEVTGVRGLPGSFAAIARRQSRMRQTSGMGKAALPFSFGVRMIRESNRSVSEGVADITTEHDALVAEIVGLLPTLMRCLKGNIGVDPELAAIPLGQARALGFLFFQRTATVGEVATGIGVSLATASELIDRLVDGGWVERAVNPADRRKALLGLTPKAARLGDLSIASRTAQVQAALAKLDPADRPAFVRGLSALVDVLREQTAQPEPAMSRA